MVKKRNSKKLIFILGLSILIFITGYSRITLAAGNSSYTQSSDSEQRLLDPFTLNTFFVITGSETAVSRPPIRITVRPTVRSYFRPELVF